MSVKIRWKKINNGVSGILVIHKEGVRKFETLGIHIKKGDPESKNLRRQVEQIRAQRELELGSLEYYRIPEFKLNQSFISYFENYHKSYTKKDVRKVKYALKKFQEFITKRGITKLRFKDVSPKLCSDFKDYLIDPKNGLSSETPYDYWKRFKGVLKVS
ncbi:MAG: phage integrase SAM-like domain-containing protein [Saprospiraceae bacterium]|nr:phage integrase SAM-like domain-containing protein [Saprospiraceae bacterium]